jgi:hypothetical protein
MLLWTGLLNPRNPVVLVGGVMASALFMDAANGAAVRIQGGLATILRADEKTLELRRHSTRLFLTLTRNTTVS